jgi:hypothetical protein
MRRTLVATVAAMLLVLGLALQANAQPAGTDTPRAAAAARTAQADPAENLCYYDPGGRLIEYICAYRARGFYYFGRLHIFFVDRYHAVQYIYERWPTAPGAAGRTSGGTPGARSGRPFMPTRP